MSYSPSDHRCGPPSPWIKRFAGEIQPTSSVLDLACGSGRHSLLMLELGHSVVACDIKLSSLGNLKQRDKLELVEADLENAPWPFPERQFAAIIVTNYLYRPLFPQILAALAPGGLLLYETFAAGNEQFGRPLNPDHLLNRGELLSGILTGLTIIAYEDVTISEPRPAALQRVCAERK
jgi:SAM-dependent methyltransferase